MQYFLDTDCDNDVKVFNTTSGDKKKVRFELVSDDGSCYICLKSYGKYKFKIGYKYSVLDEKGTVTQVLNKYYTEEEEISYQDIVSISNGPYIDLDENEHDVAQLTEHEKRNVYPMKIDIVELVYLGRKK